MITAPARTGHATVYIVDDHPLVCQGLAILLNQQDGLRVVGEAATAQEATESIPRLKPDLAVIDIGLKGTDGLELTKAVRKLAPNTQVLVLSMYDESLYAERSLKAGARGYIMKKEANEELLAAVQRVLAGRIYLSETMADRLFEKVSTGDLYHEGEPVDHLTDRELEVLRLVGQGMKNQAMAAELNLSVKTVEAYKEKIKKKLRLGSSEELIQFAGNWLQKQR